MKQNSAQNTAAISPQTQTTLHGRDQRFLEAVQMLSTDLLFRLDLKTNVLELFGKARAQYGFPSTLDDFPNCVLPYIAAEDHPAFLTAIAEMRQGKNSGCHLRIQKNDGSLRWHTHEYILQYDENGVAVEAFGKIIDIHAQKELENRSQTDTSTGCLRKEAFEMLSTTCLAALPECNHALFVIDIDNFKAINDNLGHYFGDMVLREVSDRLHALFRNSDYIGRIGGDEFMVFLREVSDIHLLEDKAKAIVEAMDITYHGTNSAYRISGSIGVSVYPQDGRRFADLYQHADTALYDVKHRGKNGYTLYHSALSKGTMENTTPFDVALRTLSQHFNPDFVAEVFNLLFESKDLTVSMQSVLQCVCTEFGASRCYVFERSKTNPHAYDNTYEWCAPGVMPEIDELQGLSEELVEHFFDKANRSGVFYCNDLTTLNDDSAYQLMAEQGIQSFLHGYIYSGNQVSYVLGLDDCASARVWSPIEISTIMHVSKIIAQFLNYKNAMEATQIISEDRLSVLDSLSSFAYIIDVETKTIRYFNRATKAVLPDLKIGDICHKGLRGYDELCRNCPLVQMKEENLTTTRNVIYNKRLNIPVLVHAVKIPRYDGKESIFVSSTDVSDLLPDMCNRENTPENASL